MWELAQNRVNKQIVCLISKMKVSNEDLMAQSADNALVAFVLETSLSDIDWAAFGPVLDDADISAAEAVASGSRSSWRL